MAPYVSMNSSVQDQQLEPCDPFVKLVRDNPEISKYVYNFQLPYSMETNFVSNQKVEGSIFVFRKKRLPFLPSPDVNMYKQREKPFETEKSDDLKSRFSCDRCRKYKKKCSRDLPECEYCASSEELCRYRPRKKSARNQKRTSSSTNFRNKVYKTSDQLRKQLKRSKVEVQHNLDSPAKQSSTIYKLLN